MRKSSLIVASIVLMSTLFIGLTMLPEVRATTFYVGGAGPGNYTTIQAAVNASNPGDTVFVYGGNYYENVIISKTISLVGDDMDSVSISGRNIGHVIDISADWVNISGFTLRFGSGYSGIRIVNAESCRVTSNRLTYTSRAISLESSNWTVISGNNLTQNGHGIRLQSSHNNTVEQNKAESHGYGIYLQDSSHNTVTHNNASMNGEYGVYLGHSHLNTIRLNNVSHNRWGVSMWMSNGTVLENNVILDSQNSVLIWYSSSITLSGNTIVGQDRGISMYDSEGIFLSGNSMVGVGIRLWGDLLNHWNTHTIDTTNTVNSRPVYYWKNLSGGSVPLNAGQVILANCTNVIVENQELNEATAGISVGFSQGNAVANNSVFNNSHTGMYFSHSTGNTITNNSILSNRYDGLWLSYSENNEISGNTLVNNLGEGIRVVDSNGNLIADNAVVNGAAGTNIVDSAGSTISDNLVVNQTWGILLQFSPNSTIAGGMVRDCGHGIFLLGSDNGTVRNATTKENDRGLRVYSSDWNIIEGNLILSNSEYGISLEDPSSNNSVFHNEIIGNAVQAYDDGLMNQWDDGYPSGGNYWSDYNGSDNKSGPNQTDPGSDGIGDTPYEIDGDSQDQYPLMNSSAMVPPRPPTVQKGVLSGAGQVSVEVIWLLSPDDGAGNGSVTGYDVYRGSSYDPNGTGYQLVASVPNGTASYEDLLRGEGDPNSYFYRVCAVDSFNNTACADVQAGKIARPLSPGPNLLSVPFVQADPDIITVLNMVKYDQTWSYDASSGKWKWRMRFKDYEGSLTRIDHTMGVWVNVTTDCNFTVAGTVSAQTAIQLYAGWNLVSFPSTNTSYTVADLKAETGAMRVEGYDPAPPYFLRVLGDAEPLLAGYGYWVKVDIDLDWTVEAS